MVLKRHTARLVAGIALLVGACGDIPATTQTGFLGLQIEIPKTHSSFAPYADEVTDSRACATLDRVEMELVHSRSREVLTPAPIPIETVDRVFVEEIPVGTYEISVEIISKENQALYGADTTLEILTDQNVEATLQLEERGGCPRLPPEPPRILETPSITSCDIMTFVGTKPYNTLVQSAAFSGFEGVTDSIAWDAKVIMGDAAAQKGFDVRTAWGDDTKALSVDSTRAKTNYARNRYICFNPYDPASGHYARDARDVDVSWERPDDGTDWTYKGTLWATYSEPVTLVQGPDPTGKLPSAATLLGEYNEGVSSASFSLPTTKGITLEAFTIIDTGTGRVYTSSGTVDFRYPLVP